MIDRINAAVRRVPNWLVYIVLFLPAPWLFYQGLTGALGPEPIEVMEHESGEIALQLLVAGLCITPLRRFAGVNLLKFRRALGVTAFVYVCLHLLVWAVLDVQILAEMWKDIVKRPYVTIGMAAFVLMIPLAATSNNLSVRRLGARWRGLHRLTYAVVPLGALHFIWLRKGFQLEPLIYLAVIIGLLLLRRIPARRRRLA